MYRHKLSKVFLDDMEKNDYICTMDNEIWKPVVGYEGAYEVSNLGRVRSITRIRNAAYGKTAVVQGTYLAIRQNTTNRYLLVRLNRDGGCRHKLVHRLVAEAFIPNPLGLPQVNHKDENPHNNHVDNLEWCDQHYNNNYGTARERAAKTRGYTVVQMDMAGNEIARFYSAKEAARAIGKSQAAISRACVGIYKQAYGFLWKYVD